MPMANHLCLPSSMQPVHRYEMKATGRADLAANEKVLDLYTSNLQLEEQLQGVRRQVSDAKGIAEKVCSCRLSKAPEHPSAHTAAAADVERAPLT